MSRSRMTATQLKETTLDPKTCKEWMPNAKYGGHAFGITGKEGRDSAFDNFHAQRDKLLPWIKPVTDGPQAPIRPVGGRLANIGWIKRITNTPARGSGSGVAVSSRTASGYGVSQSSGTTSSPPAAFQQRTGSMWSGSQSPSGMIKYEIVQVA